MVRAGRGRAHQPVGGDVEATGPVDVGGGSVGAPPAEKGDSGRRGRRKTGHQAPPALPSYMDGWPATQGETRAVEALRPHPGNARRHDANQLAQLARSYDEFGFTVPVLVDEADTILAGHGRVEAAVLAGIPRVPVVVARGWSEERKRAYVIADNQIALNATWDLGALRAELTELTDAGLDMALTGLSFDRIGEILQLEAPKVDHAAEWGGMPAFDQQDKSAWKSIVMHFRNQEDLDRFEALIAQKVNPKTRYLWFPEITIETASDKRFVGEP